VSASHTSTGRRKTTQHYMDLEEEVRRLQNKIRQLTKMNLDLERRLEEARREVYKLMSPPAIEATVLEVIDNERVLVKSTTGPNLIVRVSKDIDVSKLRPGMSVALNNRGSTIIDILPQKVDPLVKAMEVERRPNVTFKDIGGLSEQIRELYEAPAKGSGPVP